MARTWLSIRVELVEGRGDRLWPPASARIRSYNLGPDRHP